MCPAIAGKTAKAMRIVITGDIQYEEGEKIESIARDIDRLQPDIVILLGDYGTWENYGSYEAFQAIRDAFGSIRCQRLIPLLGNHDVQYEAGRGKYPPGTVSQNYERAFGTAPVNRILEFERFRILCVHTDVQPEALFHCIYECYVSDGHFKALREALESRPDTPAILITHAPPVGAGIINIPEIHLRASNAWMDQDHDYMRWYRLIYHCPQIRMWFSGHYHLGHFHQDSSSQKAGLSFFTTGAPTSASRDNQRHSRVLDVDGEELRVSTYDHNLHLLCGEDYACRLGVRRDLKEEKENPFATGCGRVVAGGLHRGENGRVYAHTSNGYLWEIDLEARAALGTLHYSKRYVLDDVITDQSFVWRICGNQAFGHRYDDPDRFMREYDYEDCHYIICDAERIRQRKRTVQNPSLACGGRPWCRIDEDTILTSYNDETGKLFFEIRHDPGDL